MLTVHHLGVSQSERIIWLCEELEIPYELKLHKRSPMLSPPEVKALHPLGAAPIIQDGSLTLAESEAVAEWVVYKHGDGRLVLPPSHPNYADYLYWYHFANGSLQPGISRMGMMRLAGANVESDIFKALDGKRNNYIKLVDDRLKATNNWLAGGEFTLADIMTVFTCTRMRVFSPFDLESYTNILAYLQRVAKRPAY